MATYPLNKAVEQIEEINVLVTGFGRFRSTAEGQDNASWLVASSLPASLPATKEHPFVIKFFTLPEPVTVEYAYVLKLLPVLYQPPVEYHYILHTGIHGGKGFTVEKSGHRDGYMAFDNDGKVPDHAVEPKEWRAYPSELHTPALLDNVMKMWKEGLHDDAQVDMRISTDAGHFLCDYIYYASLAYFYGSPGGRDIPTQDLPVVCFMHLPNSVNMQDIDTGRRVEIALVYALIESRRAGASAGD